VLLVRPLPQPLRTTVAAVVGRRLRDLMATGPAAAVRPIPAQQQPDALSPQPAPEDRQTRTPPPVDVHSVHDRHRPCAGDEGMCPRLALPDEELCGVCLGGEQPVCVDGCGRGVITPGAQCVVCADAASTPANCPGHGGKPCGRAAVTEGLCGRCKVQAEKSKKASEALWEQARDAVIATAGVEQQAVTAPF
jgi:hypothetical protein